MPLQLDSRTISKESFAQAVAQHILNLTDFSKEVGKPRPTAHPLVEQAIKRIQVKGAPDSYVADYEIVDPPPPSLEEKKKALETQIAAAESEAKYKILPRLKMPLAIFKFQTASAVEEDKRSAEQNEDIASYLNVQKAWRKLELVSAQAYSDIDDLTEDTIDSWQLPKFD